MPDAIDPIERIDSLLNNAEPRIARAFRAAIKSFQNDLDLDVVEQLLTAGNYEAALAYTQEIAQTLGVATTTTFYDAAQDTVRFLNGLDLGTILFNQVNVRAIKALQENNLRLISEFTNEQRAATRLALLDGIARGLNPRDQARNFRDSVGLTERQQAAVIRYRELLNGTAQDQREALTRELRDRRHDRTVQRSITTGEALTPEQIDRMVSRYQERYIKHRSEVIARTEALRSVHEGVEEAYSQAIDDGKIDPEDLEQTWDTSRDTRVRDTHQLLQGQKRPWGGHWQTANGILRYPGDRRAPAKETVQFRCVLIRRIKGALKEVRKYATYLTKRGEPMYAMAV